MATNCNEKVIIGQIHNILKIKDRIQAIEIDVGFGKVIISDNDSYFSEIDCSHYIDKVIACDLQEYSGQLIDALNYCHGLRLIILDNSLSSMMSISLKDQFKSKGITRAFLTLDKCEECIRYIMDRYDVSRANAAAHCDTYSPHC